MDRGDFCVVDDCHHHLFRLCVCLGSNKIDPSDVIGRPHAMPVLLDLFVYAILLGGLLVCIWGVGRIWHRQAVLRYEPRRQVPWEGIDLLLILLRICAVAMAVHYTWIEAGWRRID